MKLFYTTEEVANHFSVKPSKIRYYLKEFRIKVNTQGRNKAFTKEDILKLGKIIDLVDKQNFTITGAKEQLRNEKNTEITNNEAIEKLEKLKKTLMKLKL